MNKTLSKITSLVLAAAIVAVLLPVFGVPTAEAAEYLKTTYSSLEWTRASSGNVDGKEGVTADDAIYLLYRVFFGADSYPLN